MDRATSVLSWLVSIPDWLVYTLLGIAAGLENIVPPIPADVMVLAGGVVAGVNGADVRWLFAAVWAGNVFSALLVYGLGHHYGARFFRGRLGHFLLRPAQLDALARAYRRFGFPIIFFSRFLPVFRPIVPAFAGVSHLGFWGTAIPLALASAIWYGFLVYLGAVAGANWRATVDLLANLGIWLWIVAALLLASVSIWWWRTRHGTAGTGAKHDGT
ncbi:MAG: DedA family protein [Gemmatimonadota bacterium]